MYLVSADVLGVSADDRIGGEDEDTELVATVCEVCAGSP